MQCWAQENKRGNCLPIVDTADVWGTPDNMCCTGTSTVSQRQWIPEADHGPAASSFATAAARPQRHDFCLSGQLHEDVAARIEILPPTEPMPSDSRSLPERSLAPPPIQIPVARSIGSSSSVTRSFEPPQSAKRDYFSFHRDSYDHMLFELMHPEMKRKPMSYTRKPDGKRTPAACIVSSSATTDAGDLVHRANRFLNVDVDRAYPGMKRKKWTRLKSCLHLLCRNPYEPCLAWKGCDKTIAPVEDWNALIERAHYALDPVTGTAHHRSVKQTFHELGCHYQTRRSRCGISYSAVEGYCRQCVCYGALDDFYFGECPSGQVDTAHTV